MKVRINPSHLSGTITAPPSKSASHRALIAGVLSEESVIYNVGNSNDINATLSCLRTLGAKVECNGDTLTTGGFDPKNVKSCVIDAGESGSTLRFLIPLCLFSSNPVTIKGHGKLLQRPLDEYAELCRKSGFDFILREDSLTVCGQLKEGDYEISGQRSSQFVTGMMYAMSLFNKECTLKVTGKAESVSYIDLTKQILTDFGIGIRQNGLEFTFDGKGRYLSREFTVEGDYSNAAFLEAFNYLGGDVTVTGLREDSTQGDRVYKDLYKKLGTDEIIDLSDCPDLAPVLFALSAVYGGNFTGTRRLRIKESDRTGAMKTELEKCGIDLLDGENDVIIKGIGLKSPDEVIAGHNDHRIVMAMSVLLSRTGGIIEGCEAVRKSWPDFFEKIKKLGADIIYETE